MTIQIDMECETGSMGAFDYESVIRQVIEQALISESCPYEAEINVLLTNDEAIREINREQRGIDSPTDVLSFPMITYNAPADFEGLEENYEDFFHPETGELLLGDIVISIDRAAQQAEAYGHSLKREIAFLTAHSMMHLFGYDHMEPEEEKVMTAKQESVLEALEIRR